MLKLIKKYPAVLVSALFVALACFASVGLIYNAYRANGFDLGLFTEAIKNSASTGALFSGMEGYNHLAIHFSPILYIMTPIYWLFPHPQALLVVQCILAGVAAYLVYYIAQYFKLEKRVCLLIQVLFCVSPLVWGILLFDFHEIAFALPLLLLMIIGLLQKKWVLFGIALALSLIIKEDITLTIGALGVATFLFGYFRDKKVNKASLVLMGSAALALVVAFFVSKSFSQGDTPRILNLVNTRYESDSAQTTVQVILGGLARVTDQYSVMQIGAYLAPLCLLPLATIEWAIPALGILFMSVVSVWGGQHAQLLQYTAGAIPYLFVASIMTLAKPKYREKTAGTGDAGFSGVVLIFSILVIISILISFYPTNRGNVLKIPTFHDRAITIVLSHVPDGASVTTNNRIIAHLSGRTDARLAPLPFDGSNRSTWGFPDTKTEYVVVDADYTYENWEQSIQPELVEDYTLVYQLDGCKLYQLKAN